MSVAALKSIGLRRVQTCVRTRRLRSPPPLKSCSKDLRALLFKTCCRPPRRKAQPSQAQQPISGRLSPSRSQVPPSLQTAFRRAKARSAGESRARGKQERSEQLSFRMLRAKTTPPRKIQSKFHPGQQVIWQTSRYSKNKKLEPTVQDLLTCNSGKTYMSLRRKFTQGIFKSC